MNYSIENEYLKATVSSLGAELISVIRKEDGVEHMWQPQPDSWQRHAPLLFPYAGRLEDGKFRVKGKTYEGDIHGFCKDMEFTLMGKTENTVVFELCDSEQTLALWPFRFRLEILFTLEGDTLHQTVTVENPGQEELSFSVGFHPGFAVPFDQEHQATDYFFGFDKNESPLCLSCDKNGKSGQIVTCLGANIQAIPLQEHLFDNDSFNMTGLRSRTLGIYEKDFGRGVVCAIADFPYTVIWSRPGMPKFVCIEPWHTLPAGDILDWGKKPAAAVLSPGEDWSTTLSMSFVR